MSTSYTKSSSVSLSGGSFFTLLALLFIALKLTGVIAWSWWWVLAPLWIPWLIAAVVIGGIGVAYLVVKGQGRNRRKR